MASVHELIAAAQQNKSPFIRLLEGAAQGFGQAQQGGLDRTIKLMQLDQMRKEQEMQQQQEREYQNDLKNGFHSVGGKPGAVLPQQKIETTWNTDAKGYRSKNVKIVSGDGSASGSGMTPYQDASLDLQRQRLDLDRRKLTEKPASLTKAQEAVDRRFGVDYADYVSGGGYSDTIAQLDGLGGVLAKLEAGGSKLTGPILSIQPDALRKRTNPASFDAQQTVEQSVQRTLKKTLGGQFTEKEGVMFMQRGYDPALPEAANAQRLARTINQLKTMALAKQRAIDYYEENGTLSGFQGEFYTLRDGVMVKATKDDFYEMMGGEAPGGEKSAPIGRPPAADPEEAAAEARRRRIAELRAKQGAR